MIDVWSALLVSEAIATGPNPGQALSDIKFVYGAYQKMKAAGKFDLSTLKSQGSYKAAIAALRRTAELLDKLENDPTQGPHVEALLDSIT